MADPVSSPAISLLFDERRDAFRQVVALLAEGREPFCL
jgi:hypothetical protein